MRPISAPTTPPHHPSDSRTRTPADFKLHSAAGLVAEHVSLRAYYAFVLLVVAAVLMLWLAHWRYIYGWIMDDRYVFLKAIDTVRDPGAAFSYYNALHAYFWLIAYLPLRLDISVPSHTLPPFGQLTGQFRFLILYTMLLHCLLLFIWAWFATTITSNRPASLLSVLLFATSPTFMLWMPQLDSRLLGLPFALFGIWLLLREERPSLIACFLAGSLFAVSQSVHYTSLYLIMPVCLVYWVLQLWRHRAHTALWQRAIVFAAGCLWLPMSLEFISYVVLGIPPENGPMMQLLKLRRMHASPWSIPESGAVFLEAFLNQFGPFLVLFILSGWYAYIKPAGTRDYGRRLIVGLSAVLGLIYLIVAGTGPMFRQTSVIQPLLFLFASIGVVTTANRLFRPGRSRLVGFACLVVVVGAIPWSQASAVFQAHQGLGRALEWAHTHKGERQLAWLPIAWFEDPGVILSRQQLEHLPADTWIISYFPWEIVHAYPSLQSYLQTAPAIGTWRSLYETDTMHMELRGFGYYDFRPDPILSTIYIFDAGGLLRSLDGAPLQVESVSADSVNAAANEAANVFDRDLSPDGHTAWYSALSPIPHWLEVWLVEPQPIGAVDIIQPARDWSTRTEALEIQVVAPPEPPNRRKRFLRSRIEALEIQVVAPDGTRRIAWTGRGLSQHPTIKAVWNTEVISGMRFIVHAQVQSTGESISAAGLEEIVFPGYQVAAPPPTRSFPELILGDLRVENGRIVAAGTHFTRDTAVVLNQHPLLTTLQENGRLIAVLPDSARPFRERIELYLQDAFRRSSSRWIEPLRLVGISPERTGPGQPFGVQPTGESALVLHAANAAPGTVAFIDDLPLVTAFGNEQLLSAIVPPAVYSQPGRHEVYLKHGERESNRLPFIVGAPEPLQRAPLRLVGISPERTGPGQPFGVQPTGESALVLHAANAAPGTVAFIDDLPLVTAFGNEQLLSAIVPPAVYSQPGRHEVYLKHGERESNRLPFIVGAPEP